MAENSVELTPLMAAAAQGNLSEIVALIQAKAKLDVRSREGITALRYAIESNAASVALALINAGADVNAKDRKGITVLMEAIKRNQIEVCDALLKAGANVEALTKISTARNALEIAIGYGRLECIQQLVEHGVSIKANESESLEKAIYSNQPAALSKLIELGADPSISLNQRGKTPLMLASSLGFIEMVRVLLQSEVDRNAMDSAGQTALNIAEQEEHQEIVTLLSS